MNSGVSRAVFLVAFDRCFRLRCKNITRATFPQRTGYTHLNQSWASQGQSNGLGGCILSIPITYIIHNFNSQLTRQMYAPRTKLLVPTGVKTSSHLICESNGEPYDTETGRPI